MTRSDVGKGHPEYYQDLAARLARETPARFYVNQFGNAANPRAHEETTGPGDLGADGARRRRRRLRRRHRRHDHRPVALLRARRRRRPRWCSPIPQGSVLADYVQTGKVSARRRLVAGRRHRRGLRAAGLRPLAREEGLHHPRRRSFQACRELLKKEGILAGTSSGTLLAGGAALLPRAEARRSASSRSSATAATSTCRRSTTTTGCSTRASSSASATATCAT